MIKREAINILIQRPIKGNIGGLKNILKTTCAGIFSNTIDEMIIITKSNLNFPNILDFELSDPLFLDDILIASINDEGSSLPNFYDINKEIKELNKEILEKDISLDITSISHKIQLLIRNIQNNNSDSEIKLSFENSYQRLWEKIIIKKYGISNSKVIGKMSSIVYSNMNEINVPTKKSITYLSKSYPRANYISQNFCNFLDLMSEKQTDFMQLVILILLTEVVDESITMKGLLLAHGDSTASSIQAVVNQLCENFVFEAIDMPIESNVDEIVESTITYMRNQVNSTGLILIVDMGSLNQIYNKIQNDLNEKLLIINNLTTSIALDIGLKICQNYPFDKISSDAEKNYSINVQYFEGFAQKNNIIISCMSGLGISEKLREIFLRHLDSNDFEIFSKDYRTIKLLINENDDSYFSKTKLVITTTDLPKTFNIPNVNIYNIIEGIEIDQLELLFSDSLTHNEFMELIEELIKFFSLEGIEKRLTILNPKVVIGEVEVIVSKHENFYNVSFNGKIKLNLYMHISLMIERLVVSKSKELERAWIASSIKEEEFYAVSRSIFKILENKYNFEVSVYEISLLYELMDNYI